MLVWQLKRIKQDTMNSNRGRFTCSSISSNFQTTMQSPRVSKTSATDVHGTRPRQSINAVLLNQRQCFLDKRKLRKSGSRRRQITLGLPSLLLLATCVLNEIQSYFFKSNVLACLKSSCSSSGGFFVLSLSSDLACVAAGLVTRDTSRIDAG